MECYQGWRGVVTKLFGKFGVYALANVGNTVGLSCSNSFDISEMSHLDICEVFIFKYFTECEKKMRTLGMNGKCCNVNVGSFLIKVIFSEKLLKFSLLNY